MKYANYSINWRITTICIEINVAGCLKWFLRAQCVFVKVTFEIYVFRTFNKSIIKTKTLTTAIWITDSFCLGFMPCEVFLGSSFSFLFFRRYCRMGFLCKFIVQKQTIFTDLTTTERNTINNKSGYIRPYSFGL